jgi:DNA-binding PadR family transcriptional regulator
MIAGWSDGHVAGVLELGYSDSSNPVRVQGVSGVKRPSNALALAVLALLYERSMHPYEMSSTLRYRHKEDSIKINYGSLYAVVESLERKGLIEATERLRDGRRPERTVYRLTAEGATALRDWLSELFSMPTRQYTDFEAALSLMPALPPETVRALLAQRLEALERETAEYERHRNAPFPRLFTIEGEYQAALRRAETEFVRGLREDLERGSFDGTELWSRIHELKDTGVGEELMPTLRAEFGELFAPPPEA